MDGSTLEITESDYKNTIGKTGLIFIESIRQSFNTSIIARIVPKSKADELEDKKNQKEGILHDGKSVIRYFGSWYLDGEFDDKGNPYKRIDPEYYPEIQRDCVPTRKEFNIKYRGLSRGEALKQIIGKTEAPRIGGVKKLKECVNIKRLAGK